MAIPEALGANCCVTYIHAANNVSKESAREAATSPQNRSWLDFNFFWFEREAR